MSEEIKAVDGGLTIQFAFGTSPVSVVIYDPAAIAAVMGAANTALPDGHPNKVTGEVVAALEEGLRLLRETMIETVVYDRIEALAVGLAALVEGA